jgi:hypothetical protein
MPTVPDIHRRGIRAAQLSLLSLTVGTLYFVTDEGVTERWTGTAWESYSGAGSGGGGGPRLGVLSVILDGGGGVITPGLKAFLEVPFACTILTATLLSSDPSVLSGDIQVDLWKTSYAAFPPTAADSICGSDFPTIVADIKSQDFTLTGWTPSLATGDVLGISVLSVATFQRVTLSLKVQA